MAVAITIRNVPDEVRNALAGKASSQGRSLQEYLSAELAALARRPAPADFGAELERRAAARGSRFPAQDILAAKDADHA